MKAINEIRIFLEEYVIQMLLAQRSSASGAQLAA
jgi:hypothetical protein